MIIDYYEGKLTLYTCTYVPPLVSRLKIIPSLLVTANFIKVEKSACSRVMTLSHGLVKSLFILDF